MTVEPVLGYDLDNYLNTGIYTSDAEMISSVAVVEEKKGSGIDLAITTPENITQVSRLQYENACLTAGITDVYVAVGSIKPVTGESALAGIYKAFDVKYQT